MMSIEIIMEDRQWLFVDKWFISRYGNCGDVFMLMVRHHVKLEL